MSISTALAVHERPTFSPSRTTKPSRNSISALARKGGIAWQDILKVLDDSAIASPMVKYKTAPLRSRDFESTFSCHQMAKDLDLIREAGHAVGVPLQLAAQEREIYGALIAQGCGEAELLINGGFMRNFNENTISGTCPSWEDAANGANWALMTSPNAAGGSRDGRFSHYNPPKTNMLFAIHALDRAGALPTRLANYDAHKAFLSDASRFGISIVMSWLLVSTTAGA